METQWIRKPVLLGLGLAVTLAAAFAGCGGQAGDKDDAVLVRGPDVNITSKLTPSAPTTTPGPGAAAPSTGAAPSATSTALVKAEGWGTLKGKVVFSGDPPQPKVLQEQGKAAKDPEICAKTAPIMSERLVVDSGTKGVKNVFVYLVRPTAVNDAVKKAASSAKIEFDQKNCVYIPHALGVMTGVTVKLKSSDPTNHNVNFQLKNLSSNPLIAPGTTMDVIPQSPERTPGPVDCSIHPWMMAYWMVLDHPYFAVTDDKGNFEIKDAPAGTQKVVVWQEAVGFVTPGSGEDVNIKASDTTAKDFTIDSAKVKPAS